jgi:hypothetical protein
MRRELAVLDGRSVGTCQGDERTHVLSATRMFGAVDRLLGRAGAAEGLTIVTRDERIAAYDVETLAA